MIKFGKLEILLQNALKLESKALEVKIWNKSKVQKFIIEQVYFEQIFKLGIDGDGKFLGEYSPNTEDLNVGKTFTVNGLSKTKKAGDPYFLFDTGYFEFSFEIKTYDGGFTIFADDLKDGVPLTNRFGEHLIKPTDESFKKISEFIAPIIVEEIKKKLFKGL